jgi:hypothetical protein
MSRQRIANQVARWVVGLVLLAGLAGSGTARAQWDCYAPQPGHPTSAEKTAFIDELKVYAQEAEAQWGTPAAALMAMAANESGYGFTRIGLYANNLYGWKWTSSEAAGGRPSYVLACQPSWDPNNKYVSFKDRRDAVHFIGMKLATLARYKPVTERYVSDIRNGVAVTTAVNRWVQGIQSAGYNPYSSYVTKTVSYLNNYLSPSSTYSSTYNLYKYSPVTGAVEDVWISIDAPSPGATVSGDVAFNTSVGGGTVDTVKLYSRREGTTDWYLIASDTTSPYGTTWATNPWVTDGAYELKAEAWKGTVLKATGTLRVLVKNTAPSVSLSSPSSGATVSGDVSLQASVSGATVEGVRFYSRTAGSSDAWYLLNTDITSPYGITWATSPWVNDGDYDLKAEAYQGTSVVATSLTSVTVKNATAQTYWVDFLAPRNEAQVAGNVGVQLSAGGHPANDVDTVKLYSRAAGSTASWYLITTDASAPFALTWATNPWFADGRYELKAEAYRAGSLVASKVITVAVQNADTTPPSVSLTAPADGAIVQGNVTLSANPSDASGISQVEFYSDSGNYLIATRTSSPWSISWATDPWVKNGYQTLVARARDTAGNVSESRVTVMVDNPSSGITLNNGLDNTTLSFRVSGSAYWYGDDKYYYTGYDSARSGQVGHGQTSTLEFTAQGPKTLRFMWRVSSEQYADYLELWIDGVKQNSISGETAWAAQSWWLASGSHTVQLIYRKSSSGTAGSDAGWVDYLRLE